MKKQYVVFAIIILLFVSCRQFGGKIVFPDDEWTGMREKESQGFDWNTMLNEYKRKWTVNGLRLYISIYAHHTVFSSKEPYRISFYLEKTDDVKENYTLCTIKDVKISGASGKDYQSIADSIFPITFLLSSAPYYHSNKTATASEVGGEFLTDPVFPFTFEKLIIGCTIEVETFDSIESKTFECNLSPRNNPPEPIWQYMYR